MRLGAVRVGAVRCERSFAPPPLLARWSSSQRVQPPRAAAAPSVSLAGGSSSLAPLLSLWELSQSAPPGLALTTRGMLRAATHAQAFPHDLSAVVERELGGARGQLQPSAAAALADLLHRSGLRPAEPAPPLAPPLVVPRPDGSGTLELGDVSIEGIRQPTRPELVPDVLYHDSPTHSAAMQAR